MVDPAGPRRPPERWLRVVGDDEPPPVAPAPPPRRPGGVEAPGAPRLVRSLLVLLLVTAAGTAAAVGADRLVGGIDGDPPLHLLVVLALPFWDGLPARLAPRLGVLAAAVLAVAAVWFPASALRPEPWWRAQVSLGVACALVGCAQLLLAAGRRGRTVDACGASPSTPPDGCSSS